MSEAIYRIQRTVGLAIFILLMFGCGGGGNSGDGDSGGGGNSGGGDSGGGNGGAGPVTYTIGGTVSGLNGTVVLQNNAGNDLTVAGNGSFTFTLEVDSGSTYSVTVLTHPTGQTCAVTDASGIATANVTDIDLWCGDIPVATAGYSDKRILVAHVKFSDTGADPFPIGETTTRTQAISEFFREVSYGSSTQTYDVKPWVALPNPMSFYQQEDPRGETLWPAALSLVEQTFDLVGFDIVTVVLMPVTETLLDGQIVGYPGMFATRTTLQVGGVSRVVPVAIFSGNVLIGGSGNASVMSHEIGHGYGVPTDGIAGFLHSSEFLCNTWPQFLPPTLTDPTFNETGCPPGSDATFFPYGPYDFMGSYRGHPNAFWKKKAGWLDTDQIVRLQEDGSVTLDPIEVPSNGTKAIQIPLGTDQANDEVSYWVEYRSEKPVDLEDPVGVDVAADPDRVKIWINLPNVPQQAVQGGLSIVNQSQVYTFDPGFNQTGTMRNPNSTDLVQGGTFTDPYRGISVSRGNNSSNAATVDVVLSALQLDPAIGATVVAGSSRDIIVTNSGSQVISQDSVTIKGRNASSFQIIADNCGGTSLSPGESCLITVAHLASGDPTTKFGSVEWTSDDVVRTTPSIGIIGVP